MVILHPVPYPKKQGLLINLLQQVIARRNLLLQAPIASKNKAPITIPLLRVLSPNRPRPAAVRVRIQVVNLQRVKKVNNGYNYEKNINITHDRHC